MFKNLLLKIRECLISILSKNKNKIEKVINDKIEDASKKAESKINELIDKIDK